MKKSLQFLIAVILCTLLVAGSYAQTVYIEDYTCSSSMETYTPVGSSATILSTTSDDDGYATVALPFSFAFGSVTKAAGSNIYMSVNGFASLNTSPSGTAPSYSGTYDVLSPLGHDLHLRSNGQLKYEVSGTAPDRVLTLQWSNVESFTAGNTYNFQIKMYEGSSNIQFCYGNSTVTASKSVYCFLRENTQNDYVIAMNNWNTPVFATSGSTFYKNLDASQYPSNGCTYTFTRPTPTCNKPTVLTLGSVTANSATISWTAGGSETSWEVICAELTDDISTLTPTAVSTPSYTAQNLTNDHQYILYVRAQCPNGVETSAWKSMFFRTDCGSGIQSLPYSEDFSSYGGTGSYTYYPNCWSRISTAGNYPYISSTGGNSLYLYTSSNNYTLAVAPALDPAISINTVAARFKMYASSQSYTLKVGVMSDSSDINTFVTVATLTPSATSVWEEKDVYFSNYTGTGKYIAFLSDSRTLASANYPYIDDVTFMPMPACARPANLRSINATDNSVTLQWASAGTESQWSVKYYETGDTTTMVTTTATSNPFTVNGLTANKSYTFFVQANCGSGNSEWSVPYSTPTLYVTPATLPFVCDFESSTEAANWGFENDTCANQWVIGDAVNNTPNGNSSLYVSNDNGVNNNYTFTAPSTIYAVRDIYLDNNYEYYTLTYDYKGMGQGTTDYLRLYLALTSISMVQGNATGTVPSIPGAAQLNIDGSAYQSGQTDWRHVTLLLDKETWGNRVVRLYYMWRNDASSGENPAAAIDNIEIKGFNCPMVTDITLDANTLTANSATITWTDTLNTGNYEVVLVPKGGNPDNETPVTVSSATYTFTGLMHSTEYTAYVRVSCGTGVSAWSGLTFSTLCGQIATLPYTQNFDGLSTGSSAPMPNCWSRLTNYSTQYPYLSTSYYASGNASLYFYGTTSYYSYAVLPEIDTIALPINTLMINLKSLKTSTTSTYGRFDVGVMTDPTNINTFTTVKSFYGTDMPQISTWYNQEIMFNNYTGNGSYIAIRVPMDGTSYVYIDDVELIPIPSCLPPVDVTSSAITSDAVTVSWTPRNGEYNWNVVVVPAGTDVATGTPEPTTAFPYTVSNLLPNTAYDVYVQADCGGGDESPWSVKTSFTTKCLPTSTMPYFENFEGIGTGTGAFPNCWTRNSTYNATTPYVNSSLHSDGAAALYFYQPSGTYTTLAVTQALDLSTYNPGDLAFSFNISAYSSLSYARMDVGVMTDPSDMGTFSILKSFYPSDFTATNQWKEVVIPLTQQYTTPVYFAFYMPQSTTSSSYMYIDEVKVDYAPDCYTPTNFQVANVGATSAYLTWYDAYNVTDYMVEYSEQGQNNWTQVSVTGANSLFLTNLQQGLTYDVMLYGNCSAGYSDTLTQSFSTPVFMDCLQPDPDPVAVIDTANTSTSYYVPIGNFYNYSYTQQIYTANEVSPTHTPTVITGIALNYGYSSSNSDKTNVKIYLAHRSSSSFSSSSDWTSIADATLVYEGSLVCTNGWNTFNFQNFFSYNGTDNLVVIVDDNSGGYDGSSYVFNTHTTSSYRAMYYQNDSTDPDPANPPSGTRVYTLPDIKFYKCLQTAPLACVPPTIMVTDVTAQDITVEWAAGGSETQWEMDYKIGSGSWTPLGTVTTSPYVLNNVTNDADYTFRLRSDCGNNEYSAYATATTHVPCVSVVTLPLTENFDVTTGSGSGHMVGCWTRNTNYGSTLYPYTSSSQHYNGGYSVYFYGSSTAYSYIASPRLDDSIEMDSLLITFQAYKTSANYFIEVGVMSDPNDNSTFVPVGTFSPQNINNFEFGSANTRGYAGNGHYIAFRCPQWITNNMYIDDVVIDYIPDCYFVRDPHAVENSITATSARVTWTPNGDETDWEVAIGIAGTITDPSMQTIDMVQNTPSFEFTNLLPNTLYEVYVRANCGSSYSGWMSCTFRTGCAAITTLPYVEDFEGYPSHTSTSPTANNLPNCWDYRNTTSSSTSAYRFYPILYTSSTYAHNSQNSMRFYVYTGTSYGDEIGILPEIDTIVLPINTLRLTFWQRAYTTSSSYHFPLEVGVMSDPTNPATFVQVDSFSMEGTGSTTYVKRTVDFTNYTGGGNRIAFRVVGPTASGYNHGYVDDITIDYAPRCAAPTQLRVSGLTNNEATISWQPGDQEYEWNLIVYPVGSSPAAGVNVTVNSDTFHTLSNLLANVEYQVLLKAVCPNGAGFSESVETTFTTMCDLLTTLPFTQNFDGVAGTTSGTVNNLPDCWFNYNTGTNTSYSGYPIVYNSSTYASSGTNSLRFYTYTTSGTYSSQWAILPGIDVTLYPMNTLMLSMDVRPNSTSYPFVLEVGVMEDPLDISTFTLVNMVTINGPTTYSHSETFFSNYTGTGNIIAIRAPQPGSGYNYGYVDNIVVDVAPDCSPVNDLTVSQITATSALITWTQGTMGVPQGFELEYSEHNQNNWTTFTTQDNFYLLSGLNLNTSYDVRVRTDCGGVTSTWVTEQFVTNNCLTSSEVQIGNGTTTNYYLPLNNYYKYSYTQQIFLASEMGGPATINSVSFDYNYTSPTTAKSNVVIYLGHTTKSAFTSTNDYIADTTLTQVYSGNLNCHQGWNTFTFDVPFQYNGTDNLVLVVDDNSNSYNSSSYVFNVHTTGAYRSLYYYSDSYNMDPSNPTANTPNSSYSSGNRSNVKFGMPCDNSVTCVAPNMYVSNVTDNSADVNWVPGYYESAWNLEYKAQNSTTWTPVLNATSPEQLTGLAQNTNYQVRIQSDCGGDTSTWVIKEFRTECAAVTIPYTQNFDNDGTGSNAHPSCWTTTNNYSTTAYPYISTSYHTSGTAGLYFYGSTSTYNLAVSPQIDLSTAQMNNLQVSFQMRSSSSVTSGIVVGVMADPNDMMTFVPIDTVHNSVISTFEPMEVLLNNYSGAGEYVALKLINTGGTYSVYIDDFVIDYIPTCVRPSTLTATSTQNDITLSWNDANTGYEWIIEYGQGNFTHGNGTTVVANSNPYTITGLTPSTTYTFYVRSVCSATDSSNWSNAFHANTSCTSIATLPFIEDFDVYGTGETAYPICWGKINTYSSNRPYVNTTHYGAGVGSLYFFTGTSGTYNIAATPEFDPSISISGLQAVFMYRATYSTDRLIVGVMTNPANASTFVPVDTISPASSPSTWVEKTVYFNHYTGNGQYIAFKNEYTTTSCYAYIDNLRIENIPSCPRPTNLTATNPTTSTINLSWVENGTAQNWVVEYGPVGFTHGTGTTVQVQGTPSTTITGLSGGTMYDFYVKADCGAGDESLWSDKVTGSTLCDAITQYPYTENFDNTGMNLPTCWTNTNDYGSTPWIVTNYFDGSVTNAHSGSYAVQFFQSSSGDESTLQMPTFDLTSLSNPVLKFWYTNEDWAGDQDVLTVYYRTTTSGTWTQIATYNTSVSTWTFDSLTLPNPSATYQIKFKGVSNYGYGINIDDVTIMSGSGSTTTCNAPTGVTASNITQTSATVTWTAGGTETTWELQYKTAAASSWSSSINVTGTPSHNLTGLTAGTQYQVRVRAVCSATATSNWSTTASFTTTSSSVTPPTVTTQAASNIDATSATLHGTVTAGTETITAQGFEWKVTTGGTYTPVNATGTAMSHNLTGLTPNTGYTFRAFATTASGTTYGAEMTFTTTNDQTPCSSPTNVEVSNITENTAVVSWTQPGDNATSWDVLYRQSGADSWLTLTTSNNPYTLVGLSAGVSYEVQVIAHCSNGQTSDPSATITLTTTGINNFAIDNTVTVYPNPTNGIILIKNEELRMKNLEVYDAYGKLLNEMIVNDHTASLDLGGYAKGTYFVRVTTEKGVVTKRIVKN